MKRFLNILVLLPATVLVAGCPGDEPGNNNNINRCTGAAPLAANQVGVCAGSLQVCSEPAVGWVEPTPMSILGYQAIEHSCDGLDNDCDGNVDVGLERRFYADADDDGMGDPTSTPVTACSAPAGYSEDNTDCDDTNDRTFPGATEICDGEDNNCAGGIDEGATSTFYADVDGDSYGDPNATVEACAAPANYVTDNTDCDDGNDQAYPGATEVCDGADNNCVGGIDEGVGTVFYQDSDGDTYGNPNATVLGCTAPNGYVANANDCDDTSDLRHPGLAEVCDGIDNDCNNEIDDNLTLSGTTFDYIVDQGQLPTSAADATLIGVDLDGDGVIDNQLGLVLGGMSQAASGMDFNQILSDQLGWGHAVVPIRIWTDGFHTDPEIVMVTYEASVMSTFPNFDGNDVVDIVPGADLDQYICGGLDASDFQSHPRPQIFPVPIIGGAPQPVTMAPFEVMAVEGTINANELDVMFGGGLSANAIDTVLLPALAGNINEYIDNYSPSADASVMLVLFDAGCDDSLPGCAGVVNGVGDCASWDGSGIAISTTELLCNDLLRQLVAPDLDYDGDGTPELLSFGFRLHAVPASFIFN